MAPFAVLSQGTAFFHPYFLYSPFYKGRRYPFILFSLRWTWIIHPRHNQLQHPSHRSSTFLRVPRYPTTDQPAGNWGGTDGRGGRRLPWPAFILRPVTKSTPDITFSAFRNILTFQTHQIKEKHEWRTRREKREGEEGEREKRVIWEVKHIRKKGRRESTEWRTRHEKKEGGEGEREKRVLCEVKHERMKRQRKTKMGDETKTWSKTN